MKHGDGDFVIFRSIEMNRRKASELMRKGARAVEVGGLLRRHTPAEFQPGDGEDAPHLVSGKNYRGLAGKRLPAYCCHAARLRGTTSADSPVEAAGLSPRWWSAGSCGGYLRILATRPGRFPTSTSSALKQSAPSAPSWGTTRSTTRSVTHSRWTHDTHNPACLRTRPPVEENHACCSALRGETASASGR
jgi:hypothetical protein